MSKQYQGSNVTVVRDAKQGDAGFEANKDQVIVKLDDGSQKTAPRAEIKDAP